MSTLPPKLPPTPDPRCGTHAGHYAHRKRNETPCPPCIQARRDYDISYRLKTKNKTAARVKKWQQGNPEKRKATKKKWRLANPDKVLAENRKYRKDNQEKVAAYQKEYRRTSPERPEKIASRYKIWALKNKEALSAYSKIYQQKNKEKLAAYQKIYRAENAEKISATKKEWRLQNPDKVFTSNQRRRALKFSAPSEPYTPELILNLYGTNCHLCKEPIDLTAPRSMKAGPNWQFGLQLDHLIPLARGGSDLIENIRPAHGKCNLSKNNKLVFDKVSAGD